MNKNFTHRKSQNLVTKVSGFFTTLPVLPASPLFAVHSLLAAYYNLHKLPVVSESAISIVLNGNKQHAKLLPVYAVQEYAVIKNQFLSNGLLK